jgi:hypothetical protein
VSQSQDQEELGSLNFLSFTKFIGRGNSNRGYFFYETYLGGGADSTNDTASRKKIYEYYFFEIQILKAGAASIEIR